MPQIKAPAPPPSQSRGFVEQMRAIERQQARDAQQFPFKPLSKPPLVEPRTFMEFLMGPVRKAVFGPTPIEANPYGTTDQKREFYEGLAGNAMGSPMVMAQLEDLVGKGVIKRALKMSLPESRGGGNFGYFVDKAGDIYDLGDMFKASGKPHPEILEMINELVPVKGQSGRITGYSMPKSLQNTGLLRARTMRALSGHGEVGLEMGGSPTAGQMGQLMEFFKEYPRSNVGLDLTNPQRGITDPLFQGGGMFQDVNKALEYLNNFYRPNLKRMPNPWFSKDY